MPDLHIRFGVWLHSFQEWDDEQPSGPYFSRWLPDGEADAIRLESKEPESPILVWFDRHGFVHDHGYIQYDQVKREVDPEIMARQGFLEAGALKGRVLLQNVPEEALAALTGNAVGTEPYLKLGRRIVKLLWEPVDRFVTIIKVKFGQYWLDSIPRWDSRRFSVGQACTAVWNLKWSVDGTTWTPFQPEPSNNGVVVDLVAMGLKDYDEYLTQTDWNQLERICASNYKPSVAAYLLNRCHRLLSSGEVRYALIEGMSALEVVLEDFIRRKCDGPVKDQVFNQFGSLNARVRMALVSYLTPGIDASDIEKAARAVVQRNAIIHDGEDVTDETPDLLRAVIRIVAHLDGGPPFKFPRLGRGQALFPPAPAG